MTRIERLLGAREGDEVERRVDLIVSDDWTTPALEAPLAALGTRRAAAPLVLVADHTDLANVDAAAERARVERLHAGLHAFAERFGATVLAGEGIAHHVLAERGLVRHGMLVLGNDSHAPTLGADGAVAIAAQPTTLAAALHLGTHTLRVPATVRIALVGRLRPGVSVRDVALTLRARASEPDAPRVTGAAIEFVGSDLAHLTRSERALLANLVPELSALTATFPGPDEAPWRPERAPAHLTIDLDAVRPTALLGDPSGAALALDDLAPQSVDRVLVGTCAGGTAEELRAFERALSANLGASGLVAVPTVVTPATRAVAEQLRAEGVLHRIEAAGVRVLAPGCGPCFGFGIGRLGEGDVAAVTGPRNAVGRLGPPSARAHLVAGAGAGIAAATGRLGAAPTAARSGAARPPTASRDAAAPRITWPTTGNVVRVHGVLTTDDLTPSFVPGVGASSDTDERVLRRLLFAHLDGGPPERDLSGCVLVAEHDLGRGSNRASAVRALLAAGVRAVIARSVAPLYAAGARDEGLALAVLDDDAFYDALTTSSVVTVDLEHGHVDLSGRAFAVRPASAFERAVHASGGVVPYLLARASGAAAEADDRAA